MDHWYLAVVTRHLHISEERQIIRKKLIHIIFPEVFTCADLGFIGQNIAISDLGCYVC